MANMADVAAAVASAVLPNTIMGPNRELIKSLKRNCSNLYETASRFSNVCEGIKIYNLFEMETIGGRYVCFPGSAFLWAANPVLDSRTRLGHDECAW